MRWGSITFILAVSLVAACGSKRGELQPASLAFDEIYAGDERTIDLSVFTLNGRPLTDPVFSLAPPDDTSTFEVAGGGPLGTQPVLFFHPRQVGDQQQTLVVNVGGRSYDVPVTGRAKSTPSCPEAAVCHRITFNFAAEKCVDEVLPDGSPCGPSDCEGDQFCADSACTYVVRKDAPPVCGQDVAPVTLQPVWTYEAEPDREVFFEGLADAEGNVYVQDCETSYFPAGPCDIVSLTAGGQPRWRIPASALQFWMFQPELSIIDQRLIVSIPWDGGAFSKLAFRLSDGSLAWQREGLHQLVPASPGIAAAVLDNKDEAGSAAVVFLDTETGAELKRLDDVIPGATTGASVSDGQGTFYTSSALPPDDARTANIVMSAVSLEQGLLWRVSITGHEVPRATDGTRLFMASTLVRATANGKPLFTDPGLDTFVCFNQGQQAIYTTSRDPRMPLGCLDANLRRLGLNDGRQQSSCRVRENDVPLRILTTLVPTRDGGALFVAGEESLERDPTKKASLRWHDADGNTIAVFHLDGLVFPNPVSMVAPGAIVNGRWVMSGHVAGGRSAIFAYEVSGLALAEHGWIANGSQARNLAPW